MPCTAFQFYWHINEQNCHKSACNTPSSEQTVSRAAACMLMPFGAAFVSDSDTFWRDCNGVRPASLPSFVLVVSWIPNVPETPTTHTHTHTRGAVGRSKDLICSRGLVAVSRWPVETLTGARPVINGESNLAALTGFCLFSCSCSSSSATCSICHRCVHTKQTQPCSHYCAQGLWLPAVYSADLVSDRPGYTCKGD